MCIDRKKPEQVSSDSSAGLAGYLVEASDGDYKFFPRIKTANLMKSVWEDDHGLQVKITPLYRHTAS